MSATSKPFSEACEENKHPLLEVLINYLKDQTSVVEIGSGTGQHAVFFAGQFPNLTWHCSDLLEYHSGIKQWIADYPGNNIRNPQVLDVLQPNWPFEQIENVFSANTTHIMSWPMVLALIEGVGKRLIPGGHFILYGPFNYHGKFTSQSNAQFDLFLKNRDPLSGIRDFETLNTLAEQQAMKLVKDYEMPVNNRCLVWKKS